MLVAVTKGKGKGGGEREGEEIWKQDKERKKEGEREIVKRVCVRVRGKRKIVKGSLDGIFEAVRHTYLRKIVFIAGIYL